MASAGRARGTVTLAAAGAAALLVSACTSEPAARAGPSAAPAPSAATSAAPETDPPSCTEPVVLVTGFADRPLRVGEQRARRLVDRGGSRRVAVVPASEVDVTMRVARVAGVHPLRDPAAYPLQVPTERCPPRPVTLTVVGDVMLGRGVAQAAGDTPGRQLRAAAPRLRTADVTVGNLESTLSRAGAPRQGGDSFAAPPAVARELARAGFDVLSLANNHAGDFGPLALRQTLRRLRAAGLDTFGAGADLAAARRPAVVPRHGTSFGFVGFNAIGETPEAGPARTGALSVSMPPRTGPLDRAELGRVLRDVRALDRSVDVVFVLPHWGTQYTNVPEPVQRQVARRLAVAGADLVVGGHPHWVQGIERAGDTLVVHSLGNFVFDMDFMAETMAGVVLETVWWDGELKAAEPVPYRMDASFTPRFVPWRQGLPTLRLMWETSAREFSR